MAELIREHLPMLPPLRLATPFYRWLTYPPETLLTGESRENESADKLNSLPSELLRQEQLFRSLIFGPGELFCDPLFFKELRQNLLPLLPNDSMRIWFPFAGTGSDLFSLAILGRELPQKKIRIDYSEFNPLARVYLRRGYLPADELRMNGVNYLKSGGKATLDDYLEANFDGVFIKSSIINELYYKDWQPVQPDTAAKISPAGTTACYDIIIMRNYLLLFKKEAQPAILANILMELKTGGLLIAGRKEMLPGSSMEKIDQNVLSYYRKVE